MKFLGYDLRYKSEFYLDMQWNDERRRSQLPKGTIRWPKSVDTAVWPSWFDQFRKDCSKLWAIDRIEFDIPTFLCKTSDSVFVILKKLPTSTIRNLLLIKIHRDDGENSSAAIHSSDNADLMWTVEGYDVADEFMVSAISGSGIGQMIDRRPVAAIAVNQHSLFDDPDAARVFARKCDGLLPTHRPFSVYRIEQSGTALEHAILSESSHA